MIKQGLSTIIADEGINHCEKIINKREYRIQTLIADYKEIDKDLSLDKRYEIEKKIHDQLTSLNANRFTVYKTISNSISALEKKIKIRTDSRNKINELKDNSIKLNLKKEIIPNGIHHIKFEIENPVSPLELFQSPDARKLGLLIESIEILTY